MSIALVLKLVHILVAFWFIGGILGRNLAASQAASGRDVQQVVALGHLSQRFDRLMVIPGSSAVLILGVLTALAGGWPILGFLQGARSNWVLVSILLFLTTIPLAIFVLAPRSKIREKALEDALSQGKLTPELAAALSDRAVRAGRTYELVIIAVIVVLMVTKPF